MLQYVFRITYAYESNFPIHKALKTFSRKIIVSEQYVCTEVHTFRIVLRIILFCRAVLQAFYDMYRFSSECSELSELHILLWAGFPNPQLCQKCSIFRSYKCLCVTLYKIWNLIFCIRVWGFFPVTARLSKEICSTG